MKNAASMRDGVNTLERETQGWKALRWQAQEWQALGWKAQRWEDERREPTNLDTLLLAIRGRHSANPIDKICAIAFPFQKRAVHNFHNITFPIYDPNTPISVAWERLISTITSTKMEADETLGTV